MADKPQFYEEYQWANRVNDAERRIIRAKNGCVEMKAVLEAIKVEVDADSSASAEMVTLANQGNTLVNNANFTNFINFIQNNLGDL